MGFDAAESTSEVPSFVIQLADKSLSRLSIDLSDKNAEIEECELFDLPHQAIRLQCAKVSNKEVVISLTANLRLYINSVLFSNEATAFMLSQNFLAFVNSSQGL